MFQVSVRSRVRALGLLVLVALGAGLLLASQSNANATGARAHAASSTSGTLTLYFPVAWTNFDVQAVALEGNDQMAYLAYDQPFSLVNNKIVPYAGTLIKNTPTMLTFKLRSGITCSNGQTLTPADAARSLNRTVQSASRQVYFGSGPLHAVGNNKTGVVTLRTKSPWNGLAAALAQPISSLVCPNGLNALRKNPTYLQTHFAGSGPYVLKSSVAGASAVFKLRRQWAWGPEGRTSTGMPGTINVQIVANATTLANDLLTTNPSVGPDTGPDTARLNASSSLKHTTADTTFDALVFNMRPGHPTDDVSLRKALAMAVNRKDYLAARVDGDGSAVTGAFASDDACYDKAAQLAPGGNIAGAKQLLTSAGYTYSNNQLMHNGSQVSLNLLMSTSFNGAGEYLQAQWEKLGINVSLNNVDFVTYNTLNTAGNEDVTVIANPYWYPSPLSWAGYEYGVASPTGINRGGDDNPTYVKLFNQAFSAPAAKQCSSWAKVQRYVAANVPFAGLALIKTYFYSHGEYGFTQQYNQFIGAMFKKQ